MVEVKVKQSLYNPAGLGGLRFPDFRTVAT